MIQPETLFCPICGARMVCRDGEWYCERGKTGISQKVEEAICEAMDETPPAPLAEDKRGEVRLFGCCPRCGERLQTVERARRVCPRCSLSLHGGVFYMLQELHPHAPVRDGSKCAEN